MAHPPILSPFAHVLPMMPAPMLIHETHGSPESGREQQLTPKEQSVLVLLQPLENLCSRTNTPVVVDTIGDIFWDAFELQMRSEGRDIGSFQLKDVSRGFLMGYFDHVKKTSSSQAQPAVFATILSQQKCLADAFGRKGDVRKLCILFGKVKRLQRPVTTFCSPAPHTTRQKF